VLAKVSEKEAGEPPSSLRGVSEHLFNSLSALTPEDVKNQARSISMLPPGAPALDREAALDILELLAEALAELRRLKTP
jgi:hypothetical protein